ncbi:uncharacterized protein LOC143024777 [Oratosquilla oratoria]|uniref:uncharacterized protein LOC143024777 n=1 Tax=Oratosquilla oratoria TaxID=337810 RepID=UPI003F773138
MTIEITAEARTNKMELAHDIDQKDQRTTTKETELNEDTEGISKRCPLCWEDWWSVVSVSSVDDGGNDNTRMENHIPKFLNCHHTYCLVCLSRLVENQAESRKRILCPLCRKFSFMSKPEDLQTNYYIAPPNAAKTVHRSNSIRLIMWCEDCQILARPSCESHHLSAVGSKLTSFMDSIGKEVSAIQEWCHKRRDVTMQNVEIYSWIAFLLKTTSLVIAEQIEEEMKMEKETDIMMEKVNTLVNGCHAMFQHAQTADRQVKQIHTTLQKLKTIHSKIQEFHFIPETKYFFELLNLQEIPTNLPKAQFVIDIGEKVSFRVLAGEDVESRRENVSNKNATQTDSPNNQTDKSVVEECEDKQNNGCLKRLDHQRRSEKLSMFQKMKKSSVIKSKTLQEGIPLNTLILASQAANEGRSPVPPNNINREHVSDDKLTSYERKLGEGHKAKEKLGQQLDLGSEQKQQNLVILARAHEFELRKLHTIQPHNLLSSSENEEADESEVQSQHQPLGGQGEDTTATRQVDTSNDNLTFVPGVTSIANADNSARTTGGAQSPEIHSSPPDTSRYVQISSRLRRQRRHPQDLSPDESRLVESRRPHRRSLSGSICCPRQRPTNDRGRDNVNMSMSQVDGSLQVSPSTNYM